jgi:hypothetical protein
VVIRAQSKQNLHPFPFRVTSTFPKWTRDHLSTLTALLGQNLTLGVGFNLLDKASKKSKVYRLKKAALCL